MASTHQSGPPKPSLGERIYRRLLRVYPKEFGDEYGDQMTGLYRERAREEGGPRLWLELLVDIARTASREQLTVLVRDVRHAFRMLSQTPIVTTAVILTLALGVGANSAVFTVVNAVILRPLPYTEPDRLVELFETNGIDLSWRASGLNYLSWVERSRSFEAIAAFRNSNANLTDHGDPERLLGSAITASMSRVLGLEPIAGRPLRPEDEQPGGDRVVLLTEPLWRRRFGGDRSIVGQLITLNGEPHEVIGVVPREFRELGRAQIGSGDPEIFVPLAIDPSQENRGNHTMRVVGRLGPGVSLDQARAEMRAIGSTLEQEFPSTNEGWGVRLEAVSDSMFDARVRRSLLLLLGAVGAVLLIACANVANLLLARGVGRRRELALRSALGAGPARLVRQLLTESVCLAAVGGACGLLVSVFAVQMMRPLLSPTLPWIGEARVDATVLGFGLLVAASSGLFFGVVPAFRATRISAASTLIRSDRASFEPPRAALGRGLVAAEMGLATMLMVVSALLLQSFVRLGHVPLGFQADGVMTARISLPFTKYPDEPRTATFYRELLDSLEKLPGVQAVGVGTSAPFTTGVRARASVRATASSAVWPDPSTRAVEHIVSPDYFRAVGSLFLAGRFFSEEDRLDGPPVAIVSESFRRQAWPGGSAIGQTLEGNGRQYTVVGIVGDMRGSGGAGRRGGGLDQEPQAAVYFSATQFPQQAMTLLVRVDGESSQIAPAIRDAVREIDPSQPIYDVRSLDEWLGASAAEERLTTVLTAAFGLTALLLAAVGVYGVLSYSTRLRTHEIGVRMAVGATRRQVLGLVLGGGMAWAGAGIVLGIGGALASSGLIGDLLYEVPARDPATFMVVGVVLALVALAACYLPTARATRIDPILALRSE